MQQVVEGMMGVFFLIMLVFGGVGIAGAMANATAAQNFKVEVMERLEDCNYDATVINMYFREASRRGFDLSLKLCYSDGRVITYNGAGVVKREGYIVNSGVVTVGYDFEIPFLKISEQLFTSGYII